MESFLEENTMFIVLGIVLIIWLGIILFIFYLDKKLKEVEKVVSVAEEDDNFSE